MFLSHTNFTPLWYPQTLNMPYLQGNAAQHWIFNFPFVIRLGNVGNSVNNIGSHKVEDTKIFGWQCKPI